MKSRRSFLVIGIVMALMLSMISVASADGPKKQKAKFNAFAQIQFVGPAELIGLGETSTELLKVKRGKVKKNSDEPGTIKQIVIKTTNEGVVTFPTMVTDCGPHADSPACTATTDLMNNAVNISQHTSTAKLKKVDTITATLGDDLDLALYGLWIQELDIEPEFAASYEVYSGKINGKLDSTFTILAGTEDVLIGSARLKINRGGDATYSCFTDNPLFDPYSEIPALRQPYVPLPNISYCSGETPLPLGGRTLFLPIFLDIVDTGKLNIVPREGFDVVVNPDGSPVVVNGLTLKKLTGRLNVRVLALNGVLIEQGPDIINKVTIYPGKAEWLDLGDD